MESSYAFVAINRNPQIRDFSDLLDGEVVSDRSGTIPDEVMYGSERAD